MMCKNNFLRTSLENNQKKAKRLRTLRKIVFYHNKVILLFQFQVHHSNTKIPSVYPRPSDCARVPGRPVARNERGLVPAIEGSVVGHSTPLYLQDCF